MKTVGLSETIAASDLKGSRSRHLIEYMKILCKKSNGPRHSMICKIFVFKLVSKNTNHTVQQPMPHRKQYFLKIYS